MTRKRRRLPPHVEANTVKGKVYLSFRVRSQNGPRIRLPDDPTSEEFRLAYAAAMGTATPMTVTKKESADSISAKISAYMKSPAYRALSDSSKDSYSSRLEQMRTDHGHRAFSGLTKERIETFIMAPLANKPGAALDTLKKLRILINHFGLTPDPTAGIKRPKGGEIRAWTDAEMSAFERRWLIGTKQRTAYSLMLNMGTARVDTHLLTWHQVDDGACYRRHKTGVAVDMAVSEDLERALSATPRKHVTVINTEYGKPFTVDGFSRFMRDAITAAGLPLSCQPHGLRKTLGRLLADAGCSAHDIMAALGHTTLAEAERYTREADRKRGGKRAVTQLNEHRKNKPSQTAS
ncbi:tyrosine-type recombinase/integrase [Bradyrhizobium sp. 6(2017)]|uniref:tyrosine-type recombinase/integrase n=1 Tax=Bradyrhizobium sp. 6(2017) TaxID=1197460 RepID=UPI0013E16773|nr:tyrosine-type recombinase/integrase [Bradyrhizobium sp. 6(2017)]QIG94430.1 tyrosine-type recombinase/integrase [Bradyrhizobium sp. 6(2017)]